MTRVGLTTTSHRAAPAAHSLREAGHEPVLLPCIEVRRTDAERIDQIRHLAHTSDVILITSARAVRAVWDDEPMPQTSVLTVGDVSAAAVRKSGGVVTFAGTGDLAEVLDSVQLGNHTILYPCSSLTDHTLRHDQIEAVGAKPVIITAYHVTPIPPADDRVDVVVFASPSAVDGWLLSRPLEGLGTVAIGPTTEKRLLDAGVTPTAVSDRPDLIHTAHLAVTEGVSHE